MRAQRAGFTLVELLLIIAVSGVLSMIAISQVGDYVARQGARNARDEFVYMAARARAAAIERSVVVRLEVDPATDRVWVVTNRSGVGDTLEVRRYTADENTTITTGDGAVLTVCYSPRGYATSCTSISAELAVDFTRGTRTASALVRPLGQVLRK
jgi:prepilin-type N-terminal cleavage/methylation domain-containing protein